MSAIAEILARLIAAGTPPDVAALAVTEAFAAGASCGNSGGIPVDTAAEKRRAYDRDRKRAKVNSGGIPVETPRNSEPPLTVLPASRDSEDTKKEKKVRARKHPLPPEFQPDDGHFAAALKLGRPRQYVFEKTEDMRIWAGSSGALKVDWGLTLHGFMRRDASKYSNNGKQNGQDKSVLAAFDRLEQSLAGGDDNALRQDDLLSLPSR